jgi:UDP-N-acetylmuramate dehydrogenase
MTHTLRGTLSQHEALKDYTSWRVGGPAKQIYKPADLADLSNFLQTLENDEPLIWLGLGSNTLIRDGGFKGTVIITQGTLNHITQDNLLIRAEAGVACATLARYSARNDLRGLEFLAGIPGTIGGALRMNAGCFNGETWTSVVAVETMNRHGEIRQRKPQEFEVAYRSVIGLKEEWFVVGHFQLTPGDKQTSLTEIRELLDRRANTQPTNEANCGSVFRNPPKDYAARLIESCGLKGYRIGGAIVSEKHANFIINDGTATAEDIENMIVHVRAKVFASHGIELQQEVHIIGEKIYDWK